MATVGLSEATSGFEPPNLPTTTTNTYINNNNFDQNQLNSLLTDSVAQTKLLSSLILFMMTMICGYLPVRTLLNQNYIQHAMFAGGGVLMATAFCHLIPEAHDNYKLTLQSSGQGNFLAHSHAHSHNHNHNNNNNNNNNQLDHDHDHSHNHQEAAVSNTTSLLASQAIPIANANLNYTLNSTASNLLGSAIDLQASSISNHGDLHLAETAPESANSSSSINVPYLEITLCCGFFFMYLVEQLMVRFINTHTHEHPCLDTSASQLMVNASGTGSCIADGSTATGGSETLIISPTTTNESSVARGQVAASGIAKDTQLSASSTTLATNVVVVDALVGSTTASSLAPGKRLRRSKSISSSGNMAGSVLYKFIRGLLIVSAFGAHAIFDGVAIGSQETVEKVWTLFLAISCHKLIIAAVVGLELFSATLESHLWTLVHLAIFSIMSPLGIILVVIAQNSFHVDSNHPTMILLQSFATGTLLYIVFVEILQPKSDQPYERSQFGKSFSLIAGFALMLMVLTLIGD